MSSDLQELGTFATEAEAALAKSILEANGIRSLIKSAPVSARGAVMGLGPGTRLFVQAVDLAAARELLDLDPG